MIIPFLVLLPLLLIAEQGQAKKGYNFWAKERLRFLHAKVNRDPYNAQLQVLLAEAYHEDGQPYKAARLLKEALQLDSTYVEAHCNLAIILHNQGQLQLAEQHYQHALALDSTLVEAMSGLGTLYSRSGRESQGLRLLNKVLEVEPERIQARYNIAVVHHKLGDYKTAIDHFEALRTLSPLYPGVKLSLGRAYYSQGLKYLQAEQYELALQAIDAALQYVRYSGDLFFAKGLGHMKLEQYDRAEPAFKEAVRLVIDHVPAMHNLASIYERTERLEEAQIYYQKVQQLVPHLHTIEAAQHAQYDIEYLVK